MRTKEEIKTKIGDIVKKLPTLQHKEKVISDMAAGFIDGLTWVLGQESILEGLSQGDLFDKGKDKKPLA